jgi:antirestriction protein ArdC
LAWHQAKKYKAAWLAPRNPYLNYSKLVVHSPTNFSAPGRLTTLAFFGVPPSLFGAVWEVWRWVFNLTAPTPNTERNSTMNTERAQEVKTSYEERLKSLAELTDAAQKSAQFIAYLKTAARFHKYSPFNIWLILFQNPSASRVAGYNHWKELKRQVRKGEHGIAILAPCGFASCHTETDEETGKERKVFENANRFKVVTVFDVEQTEGEPLPEPLQWRTEERNAKIHKALIELANENGCTYREQNEMREEAHVNYKKREIVSRPTAGTSALIHEAAHMLLHEGRPDLTSEQKETEAEATAFIVCEHFGIETNAPNYLAHWSTPEQIKESGERIIKCASRIIEAC